MNLENTSKIFWVIFCLIIVIILIIIFFVIYTHINTNNKTDNNLSNLDKGKNIVLGLYENLPDITPKGGLRQFLSSLRKYNKDCIVIVISKRDKLDESVNKLCEKYNAIKWVYNIYKHDNIESNRLFEYKDILDKTGPYNKVLISDMNDAFFQEDPFSIKIKPEKELYVGSEISTFFQGNSASEYIKKWYNCIGAKFPEKDVPIYCSGVIYGTGKGMQNYLDWFTTYPSKCNEFGNDQGLLNIYVYKYPERVDTSHISTGDICHLALYCDYLTWNKNNQIINQNGIPYKIIHHSNRCERARKYFEKVTEELYKLS